MEFNKAEVLEIEQILSQKASGELNALSELQLALIGGGNAAVDFG